MTVRRALPASVGLLLVLCAALVILGVSLERGGETHTGTGEVTESVEPGRHDEHAGDESSEHVDIERHADTHDGESALAEALESPAALSGLAIVSLALAVLVWRRPTRWVTLTVAVASVAAGVADGIEVGRHLSADRSGLAVLAAAILLLRIITVAGAIMLWRTASREGAPAY
jgi:hypothetical protein